MAFVIALQLAGLLWRLLSDRRRNQYAHSHECNECSHIFTRVELSLVSTSNSFFKSPDSREPGQQKGAEPGSLYCTDGIKNITCSSCLRMSRVLERTHGSQISSIAFTF